MAHPKPHKPIVDVIPAATKNRRWRNWRRLDNNRSFALAAVVVVVLLGAGLLYHHHRASHAKTLSGQSQIDDTVNKVSKLMLLPSGEQPTLAIVNDASKYSSASFFKNAANGDRLLVYAQAHEAILYRPSINKIIAVAPLSVNPQASSSSTGQ